MHFLKNLDAVNLQSVSPNAHILYQMHGPCEDGKCEIRYRL